MKKITKKSEHQAFIQRRDALLPMLAAIEQNHGKDEVRSAMRKHLLVSAKREQKQAQIARLERQLEVAKKVTFQRSDNQRTTEPVE